MVTLSVADLYPHEPGSKEDRLRAIDLAIHHNVFGHSSLVSHLAAPSYSTDPRACKRLIDLLGETYAWFDISKLDDEVDTRSVEYRWEVCICNMKDATGYGETMELAVCNICLLDEVLPSLQATVSLEKQDGEKKR